MDAMYCDERIVAARTVDSYIKNIGRKIAAVLPDRESVLQPGIHIRMVGPRPPYRPASPSASPKIASVRSTSASVCAQDT